jgi:hypothetical protein
LWYAPDALPKPDATKADSANVDVEAGFSRLEDVRPFVPGFIDPAGCRPNLRFRLPAGARRTALYRALEEALKR